MFPQMSGYKMPIPKMNPEDKKQVTSVTLSPKLLKMMNRYQKETSIPRSAFVENILLKAMEKHFAKPVKKKTTTKTSTKGKKK